MTSEPTPTIPPTGAHRAPPVSGSGPGEHSCSGGSAEAGPTPTSTADLGGRGSASLLPAARSLSHADAPPPFSAPTCAECDDVLGSFLWYRGLCLRCARRCW